MKVAQKNVTTAITDEHLASFYYLMQHNDDNENAEKIVDLFEKKQKNEFTISFAGHFSAGKSSMINYLLGKDVLPKSPIPTSANIVKITSGEGVARVFFKEEIPVEYDEPYDIDMIKNYCMDKDTIKRIEISTSDNILPSQCSLLDTPGIDAADDADRLMTESALHIVDVLYYVMDYNHVQSEVNLYFLQEIQSKKIPFYIIINQVDKHNEQELSFSQFDQAVKQTFSQWNIIPEAVYYSSVVDEQTPHNHITNIKSDLFALFEMNEGQHKRLEASLTEIIHDHKTFLKERYEEQIAEVTDENIEDFDIERLNEIKKQIIQIEKRSSTFENEWFHELNQTLKNAYLMPAHLRDQAAQFLEAQQKDFKVGFFNSKKKTEAERQERLTNFLQALQKTIETTIQWKLRDKFMQILQTYQINDDEIVEKTQSLAIDYERKHLLSFVKSGATINGNYILNYTNEISNDIKNKYRQKVNELFAAIKKVSQSKWEKEKTIYLHEKEHLESIQQTAASKKNLTKQLQKELAIIDQLLENPTVNADKLANMKKLVKKRQYVKKEEVPVPTNQDKNTDEMTTNKTINDENEVEQMKTSSIEHVVEMIEKVSATLTSLDGFKPIVDDLLEKKTRLNNRELTIALFGAFSAGKSSFSNALFGEHILPVSPNPTTAVISRISPITEKHQHGTVIITLKDEATLLSDLKTIMNEFTANETEFSTMIEWMKQEQIYKHPNLSKTYQSYLLAILNGYEQRKNQLGKKIAITLEEFPAFVTDETKACYIETVDLYYDCALTQKGITLVDTPGADSVNARHTNVAFDYIKQADAIIYVTYYNHAITSADRDFLKQLGRVKDAFELDKMFFIVNAADLAANDSDLQLVLNYVEEQLLEYGIRQPNIYPVSSKLSLEEKVDKLQLNEQMQTFEKDFYRFIEEDLAALTIQATVWDINRAKLTLQKMIESLKMDQTEKAQRIEQLNHQRVSLKKLLAEVKTEVSRERLIERIERQLHFVLERLYIRFHDMFSEHFNPTTITESGRQAIRQLEHNRNQFIDYVGYELLQEVRAVTLRMEAYMKELLKDMHEQIQQEIHSIDATFMIPSLHDPTIDTPRYEQAFLDINMSLFSNALRIFKNTRTFFEQNEREKMKELFYEALKPLAAQYLTEQKQIMESAYEQQWQKEVQKLQARIELEIDAVFDQNINVLTDVIEIDELENKYDTINKMVNIIHEG